MGNSSKQEIPFHVVLIIHPLSVLIACTPHLSECYVNIAECNGVACCLVL